MPETMVLRHAILYVIIIIGKLENTLEVPFPPAV